MPVQRQTTLDILRRLAQTSLGQRLVLGGSSGLHAVSETIPALTEDVDLLIDADWVGQHEVELLSDMEAAGFIHLPGTCTLSLEDGSSIDLVGYSRADREDRIGGSEQVPVMVFADLSTVMTSADPIEVPTGGLALSPAALVVAKLLTVRHEKGSKDKLQALLLIDEKSEDEEFLTEVRRLFSEFDREYFEDAVADAQVALLSISTDDNVAGAQARGYAKMRVAVARGFEVLDNLMKPGGTS